MADLGPPPHKFHAGAGAVTVTCYHCGRRFHLDRGYVDLNGPAFRAYYCAECYRGITNPAPKEAD